MEKVERWIEIPAAGQEDLELPAPGIKLVGRPWATEHMGALRRRLNDRQFKRSETEMKFETERQEVIDEWPSLVFSSEAACGAKADNTLLPMLVAGLVMIVLGGIVVMVFV